MITYWEKYNHKLTGPLLQHLHIVGITLLFSILLATLLTLLFLQHKSAAHTLIHLLGAVYSIPSLALFAILIPIMGIGERTAIVVLVLYNQFLLMRNFFAGFDGVNPAVVEAATGMGMKRFQVLVRIQLPLAFPAILAGIRLALISTVGIATIAATINAGGLGTILLDGLRTLNYVKIWWGVLLSAGLAIVANLILTAVQRVVEKKFYLNN
ncbi:glycine/betaine ABC transporter permease [Clostridia bacterium]|nr:glycine/betaine ABC transporter permease [Clostridia bacterium]